MSDVRMSMTSEVASRFDRVASQWDGNSGRVALARAVAEAVQTVVPLRDDMQVMDFGAGTGLLTLALLPWVGTIMAVDTSSEMLRALEGKVADMKIGNVRMLHGDIAGISLPESSFDLVVSSMAMHHIRDVPALLARLRPCLRPGGWIALADLDAEDGSFHPDSTGVYHHGFDRHEISQWLQSSGFACVTAREVHRIARPTVDGALQEYGVFLVVGKAA